jgi:hypothetical protein
MPSTDNRLFGQSAGCLIEREAALVRLMVRRLLKACLGCSVKAAVISTDDCRCGWDAELD